MPTSLITGSNRGIGLEWVRQLAHEGWRVFATCRRPFEAQQLQTLAEQSSSVRILRLDVTSAEDVYLAHQELHDEPVDLLVNNAGIYIDKASVTLGSIHFDEWRLTFDVNTLGPVRVTQALADNVARSERRQVVITTSHMGSITDIEWPGDYYYRSSKAALNAAFHGLAEELRPRGVNVNLLHPGAVATRMGGPESSLSAEESVRAMRRLIDRLTLEHSGRFYRFNGVELPW